MIEVKRKIVKITEWRSDCVYKTQVIGEIWVDDDLTQAQENAIAKENGGDLLSEPSMEELAQDYASCHRTKKD